MVCFVTAAGDPLSVLTAQLALLTTATLAGGLHAALRILLPSTSRASGPPDPIAWILGLGFAHVDLGNYRGHLLPRAAGLDGLGILATQLTLLSAAAMAEGVHASGHTSRDGGRVFPAKLTLFTTAPAAFAFNAAADRLC